MDYIDYTKTVQKASMCTWS